MLGRLSCCVTPIVLVVAKPGSLFVVSTGLREEYASKSDTRSGRFCATTAMYALKHSTHSSIVVMLFLARAGLFWLPENSSRSVGSGAPSRAGKSSARSM